MLDFIWPVLWTVGGLIFAILVLIIAFGAPFGAPFLPTHAAQVLTAFELIDLKKGQTLIELGSGDGRVLREAARRGINAVGFELNPFLVLYSRIMTWQYRRQVKIIWGNFWRRPLPASDAIFVFLLGPHMKKIDQKVVKEAKKPQKLVCYAFAINGKKPTRVKEGMYLYRY